MPRPVQRIVLFGDNLGVPQLLNHTPDDKVAAIVGAAIRPNYINRLKEIADTLSVPLLIQPKFSDTTEYAAFSQKFNELKPDCIFCSSYSMLIRSNILNAVQHQAFNLHYALLPHHRGPNPIQWALIHGDTQYGASLHLMGDDFDNGDIVDQISLNIKETDTWVSLFDKISAPCDQLLERTIPHILKGDWVAKPQDPEEAFTNPRIERNSFEIDFAAMTDIDIFNIIRAQVAPLKGPYIRLPSELKHIDTYLPLDKIADLRKQYS